MQTEHKIYTQVNVIMHGWMNRQKVLILKVPIMTAADNIHKYFFIARQRIHMKLQALFSSKNKSKKIKVSSAALFVWRFKC